MANYLGVRCPVCNKKFTQPDDIVVCPVCGAPHHRECYLEKGECAFESEHISGNVWRSAAEREHEPEQAAGGRLCPACGAKASADALFCQACGANLNAAPFSPGFAGSGPFRETGSGWGFPGSGAVGDMARAAYGGVKPEEELDGVPARDLARYVGANTVYYLPRFRRIASGKNFSPNLSALFFGFFYYFYRKMNIMGILLLALYIASLIPGFLYTKEIYPAAIQEMGFAPAFEAMGFAVPSPDSVNEAAVLHYGNLSNLARFIYFIICAALSFYGNRLYFQRCVKEVSGLKADDVADSGEYEALLIRRGGTSGSTVAAAALTVAVLYFISSFVVFYLVLGG